MFSSLEAPAFWVSLTPETPPNRSPIGQRGVDRGVLIVSGLGGQYGARWSKVLLRCPLVATRDHPGLWSLGTYRSPQSPNRRPTTSSCRAPRNLRFSGPPSPPSSSLGGTGGAPPTAPTILRNQRNRLLVRRRPRSANRPRPPPAHPPTHPEPVLRRLIEKVGGYPTPLPHCLPRIFGASAAS